MHVRGKTAQRSAGMHLVNKAHTANSTHVDKMNPVVVRNAHHFPRHRVRPQEASAVLLRPVVLDVP